MQRKKGSGDSRKGNTNERYNTYSGCSGMRTIHIPKETYAIGDLLDIPNLESVTIDEKNQYFALIDGVLFDKTGSTLLRYPEWKRDEKYVVPDGVKTIQKEAFIENNHLEEVIISNSVTSIRDRAFLNCRNLTRITIPPRLLERTYWLCIVSYLYATAGV